MVYIIVFVFIMTILILYFQLE